MDFVNKLKDGLLAFLDKEGWLLTQINKGVDFLAGIYQYLPAIILIALGLVVLFFGKKILPLEKILFFFGIGFFLGFQILTPMAAELIKFEATPVIQLIIGCVVGVIAILLFKVLYFLCVVGVFGGGAFAATVFVAFPKIEALAAAAEATPNLQYIVGGIVALVAILVGFWLLKFFEMLATSIVGAAVVVVGVKKIYNFSQLLNLGVLSIGGFKLGVTTLVVVGVLALIGWIVQIKTRRLY